MKFLLNVSDTGPVSHITFSTTLLQVTWPLVGATLSQNQGQQLDMVSQALVSAPRSSGISNHRQVEYTALHPPKAELQPFS